MNQKELRERLVELSKALAPSPPLHSPGAKGTYTPHVSPPAGKSMENLLDHVRLQSKYVIFDLEATRRENRYLRKMLERRTNLDDASDGP